MRNWFSKATVFVCAALVTHCVPSIAVAADAERPPDKAEVKGEKKEVTLDLGKEITLKLILVPAGKFTMGSPENEADRRADEGQHEVTISKSFYLAATEVTQEQYEAVMGANPAKYKGAKNPVDSVSWNDAAAFCKKLSTKTGKALRLPTEAEYEYACRAGSKDAFSCRDVKELLATVCLASTKPSPASQRKPNAWGLYDMQGNLWEWCSDWYGPYPDKPVTDPGGPATGEDRVLRGGCFHNSPKFCRAAVRAPYPATLADYDFGFRIAIDAK